MDETIMSKWDQEAQSCHCSYILPIVLNQKLVRRDKDYIVIQGMINHKDITILNTYAFDFIKPLYWNERHMLSVS